MSIQSYGNARAETDAFAHGIHPRALTDGGLAAALTALTRRAGVPVQLTISTGRLPLAIEAAVYFLCSDALTNVAKYSGAAHVAVDVNQSKRRITATVADDGVGGGRPEPGLGPPWPDRQVRRARRLVVHREPQRGWDPTAGNAAGRGGRCCVAAADVACAGRLSAAASREQCYRRLAT
jgi:hypothetical protein